MKKVINTDVAIIGAGTAGLSAFRAARNYTENLLLIEGGPYGTTCARVGCMPAKLLIAAANVAHHTRHTTAFGIHVDGSIRINSREVMARLQREKERFVSFILNDIEAIPTHLRLQGYAHFIDPHTLQVGDNTQVKADRIVIATGSSAAWPDQFNALQDRLITSDNVFTWSDLPTSVAVFGPGVIGLELGQALHRLGVRVRLFGHSDALGPLTDPDVKFLANTLFNSEFYLDTNAYIKATYREADKAVISFLDNTGKERTESFDYLLATTGRQPNFSRLGLENCGLELDSRCIPFFDPFTLRCGESHIFIAGDANHHRPLLHEAADEGRIAGDNAGRYPDIRGEKRRTPLSIVFCEPNIALVGQSYQELEKTMGLCDGFEVGEVNFSDQGRSRVMGLNQGLLRVYGEHGTGRLLGAEMIGPRAEHIAQQLAWAIQQQLSVTEILKLPFYHPVIEEGVRTALRDLNSKLKLGPAMIRHCLDCGPGT